MQNAFPFEIHKIDECITAMWRAGNAPKLPLDIGALCGRGLVKHLGQRSLQTRNHELRLNIDRPR